MAGLQRKKLGARWMIVGEGGVTQAAVSMHWREPILKRPASGSPVLSGQHLTQAFVHHRWRTMSASTSNHRRESGWGFWQRSNEVGC
jgi:hypothetical protein